MTYLIIALFAVFGPLFVLPVELVLPYPYVIEELFNCILIIIILVETKKRVTAIRMAILVGVLFSITETVLYIYNIALVGQPGDLVLRLILTAILHVATCLIMLVFGFINRWLIFVGLGLAILLHPIISGHKQFESLPGRMDRFD